MPRQGRRSLATISSLSKPSELLSSSLCTHLKRLIRDAVLLSPSISWHRYECTDKDIGRCLCGTERCVNAPIRGFKHLTPTQQNDRMESVEEHVRRWHDAERVACVYSLIARMVEAVWVRSGRACLRGRLSCRIIRVVVQAAAFADTLVVEWRLPDRIGTKPKGRALLSDLCDSLLGRLGWVARREVAFNESPTYGLSAWVPAHGGRAMHCYVWDDEENIEDGGSFVSVDLVGAIHTDSAAARDCIQLRFPAVVGASGSAESALGHSDGGPVQLRWKSLLDSSQ